MAIKTALRAESLVCSSRLLSAILFVVVAISSTVRSVQAQEYTARPRKAPRLDLPKHLPAPTGPLVHPTEKNACIVHQGLDQYDPRWGIAMRDTFSEATATTAKSRDIEVSGLIKVVDIPPRYWPEAPTDDSVITFGREAMFAVPHVRNQ